MGILNEAKREIKIKVPEAFSFAENLKYMSRSDNECMYDIKDNKIYKAIPLKGETFLIEIRSENDRDLIIQFITRDPSQKQVFSGVEKYVKEWFDLDRDLEPFYELAKSDPLLKKPVHDCYGLRIVGITDLFEALCWAIIGQQINLPYAYTLKRRFVESFGRHIEWEGQKYWLFPTPDEIVKLSVADLAQLKMTTKKSEYLIQVAKLISEDELSKEKLLEAGDIDKAEKMLVKIRGIGPWTANYALMRCLRFPSAFPIDDVGLQNAIKHLLSTDKKPTKGEILKMSSGWANWEAYATFYLWRVLY